MPYPGQPGEVQPEDAFQIEDGSWIRVPRAGTPAKRKELTSRTLIVDLRDPAVRNRLASFRTSVLGAIQLPGDYLVAPGVGLDAVVGAVGGLTIQADLTGVEITSTIYDAAAGLAKTSRTSFNLAQDQLERIKVQPGDVVRVRELFSERDSGQVIVRGQVRFPGKFDLLRGERLSSVLARAGGLTDIAYPYGAVFTRRSAARAEEDGYRRAAQELERQFTVLVSDTQNISPQGVQFIRDTIERLQSAEGVGRVSVESDPARLAARPERDTILEPDDFIFIPRRPNSVSVTGEVLSAGSYMFATGRSGSHYVKLAGGYAPASDRGRTFVLMPDGTARPLHGSILSFGGAEIVPGATVIVPRDLRPFQFRQLALDLTQIISQLAVSAASIAVISRNQ
jgi:protein involved in polysaccharide export with SLBB domain